MHKTTYKINGGTSVNTYVASNIHILSVWLPLLTCNMLLICHAICQLDEVAFVCLCITYTPEGRTVAETCTRLHVYI